MHEAHVRDLLEVYFTERPTKTYEQERKLLSPQLLLRVACSLKPMRRQRFSPSASCCENTHEKMFRHMLSSLICASFACLIRLRIFRQFFRICAR
jgi:hypothetical protein